MMLSDIARTRPILSPSHPKSTPPEAAPTRKTAIIAPNHLAASPGAAFGPNNSTSAGWPTSGKSACSNPSNIQPRKAAISVMYLARVEAVEGCGGDCVIMQCVEIEGAEGERRQKEERSANLERPSV